ncbi:unnamed protein product [Clonostachys rosea]|uniref:NACHT domain-containing protein n=1 Tax=Bionectria ochroleuca TaxID=29856 RepID=A0ABY6U6Y1_BIOOC|nr:unnamed protein product [Clonostachys rosea]
MMPCASDYTVGWICAVSTERVAAEAFLDEIHPGPHEFICSGDHNDYTLGRMGKHNVAIATLPDGEYGVGSAAGAATDLVRTFVNVRIGLMVGIGGGVPSKKHDIRLGDVVVSASRDGKKSVVHYDLGKSIQGQEFRITSILDQPPRMLRSAVSGLRSHHEGNGNEIDESIQAILERKKRLRKKYGRPKDSSDMLFRSHFIHPKSEDATCAVDCCADASNLVVRAERDEDDDIVTIHYGAIASGNQLMKDALLRDEWAKQEDILCFEMEAAGLANRFPCIVIRGICDYSDSHKSKEWQGYASMTAAAYAKDLLLRIAPSKVEAQQRLIEAVGEARQAVEAVLNDTSQIKGMFAETSEKMKQSVDDDHMIMVYAWVYPPNSSVNLDSAREKRHRGTGKWILNNPTFEQWVQKTRRHIWVNGISGSGKTVLSAAVFDYLKEELPDHTIIYFFFDFTSDDMQNVSNLVASLIFQLFVESPEARKVLDKEFTNHKNGFQKPSASKLSQILAEMIRASGNVFIVIDALDECTERMNLLDWLKTNLLKDDYPDVSVLLTGRPGAEFENHLRPAIGNENCIPINVEMVNRDIWFYVMDLMRTDTCFLRWEAHPDVLEKIQNAIIEKSDGMFRLAACQLEMIRQSLDLTEVEEHLSSLPQTLHTMYDRILTRIPKQRKEKAMRLLHFLVYTKRPLSLDEAVDLVAINLKTGGGSFEEKRRMPNAKDIISICPDFVSLVARGEFGELDEIEVRLSHLSVKEYVLEQEVPGFGRLDAAISITHCCLTYIACLTGDSEKAISSRYPLSKYAAETWFEQARLVQHDDSVEAAVMDFFTNDNSLKNWTIFYQKDSKWAYLPRNAESLYLACLFGMEKIAVKLVSSGVDVNARGGQCNSVLQAACTNGHLQIVRLLLENGADVNVGEDGFDNPLQAAARYASHQVVELLLEKGAKVNIASEKGYFNSALQAACRFGQQKSVEILLEKGADVNRQGGWLNNALQAACARGNEHIIRLLLERGADVNAQGGESNCPLQAAAENGHLRVVELLLEKGADINAHGGRFYHTALEAAAIFHHKKIVQLLLDKGADVHLYGGEQGSAIQAACRAGDQEIVQLLLDNGADVNTHWGPLGSPFHAACMNEQREMMAFLLEKGADLNLQGGYWGSPIQYAIRQRDLQLIQYLLENGADVTKSPNDGRTAIHGAAVRGDIKIAGIMLKKEAEICGMNNQNSATESPSLILNLRYSHLRDEYGHTPLLLASQKGDLPLVNMFIDKHPFSVNALDWQGSTALMAAVRNGHVKVVERLLGFKDIEVDRKDGFGRTLLWWAKRWEDPQMLEVLLHYAEAYGMQEDYNSSQVLEDLRLHNSTVL